MAWFLEQLDRLGSWLKARQQQKALSDLQRGQDILRQMEADGAAIVERSKPAEPTEPAGISRHDTAEVPTPPATKPE